ncbi:Lrp/AsnC family transcriptional regulator [Agrococcus jenensis]|uniref:AsnC family transcriptional regulator n=1 Tax=Agrococcus jenensis TaxID=46353 RepID=A0A3N2AVA8_9MICO|nr:winged helix-turn-helix transcriptional regulator [Agrococcus jenensis]ROR66838.1 AsnC family transcriptional regulator [Agrococcus jenensis]
MQRFPPGELPALLDATDLDIVAALHIAPRVPTAVLADVLGMPTSTANRRLARMQQDHLLRTVGRYAWQLITSSNPFELWITSAPGESRAVLEQLLRIPDVQFAMHASGPADIYANLYPLRGSDPEELLTERIPSIPGVRAIDSRMILESAKVGQSWRFQRLADEQVATLEQHRTPVSEPPLRSLDDLSELEFQTMRALGANARVSAAEVARQVGTSASTASRAIRMLLATGAVSPRVEIQPELVGYPLNAVVSIDVRPRAVQSLLDSLVDHPSVRLLSTVTGDAPVSLYAVFAGPADLSRFVLDDLGSRRDVRSTSSVVALRLQRRYWIDRDGHHLGAQVEGVLRR